MQPEQYRLPFNHHPFKGKYNSYEQADSIKNACFQKADNAWELRISPSWLLHFTRKFNLAIQSRFPDFRIITSFLLLIQKVQWIIEKSLLCYSDRIVQDSHLIPFSEYFAENTQHFICFIWNYTDIIVSPFCINVKKFPTKNLQFYKSEIPNKLIFNNRQDFPWNIDQQSPGSVSGWNRINIFTAAFFAYGNSPEYMEMICHHTNRSLQSTNLF